MIPKHIIVVFVVVFIFVALPLSSASADTECCCIRTATMLNIIEEVAVCLDGWVRCGECSAYYVVTSYGYGCIINDECPGEANLDCWETGQSFITWDMIEGSLDDELCRNYGPECHCELHEFYVKDVVNVDCNQQYCAGLGVNCECPAPDPDP
jgi:hypothetical protein